MAESILACFSYSNSEYSFDTLLYKLKSLAIGSLRLQVGLKLGSSGCKAFYSSVQELILAFNWVIYLNKDYNLGAN